MEDTSQFDSDVASSNDDSLLGEILEVEESIRVKSQIVTRNILGKSRSSSDSDNDSVGSVLALFISSSVSLVGGVGGRNGKSVLVDETSVSSNVFNSILLDVCGTRGRESATARRAESCSELTLLIDTVQSLNVLVSLVLESRPVDFSVLFGNSETIRVGLV